MFKIICSDLTGELCDFSVEGETEAEVKEKFYAHGAESPIHKEKYQSVTDEEKMAFVKKLDEYLASQG